MCMLIVTVVLQHNLGIDGLILIHHIVGKFNFIVRLARRTLKSHQRGPWPKKFGDPRCMVSSPSTKPLLVLMEQNGCKMPHAESVRRSGGERGDWPAASNVRDGKMKLPAVGLHTPCKVLYVFVHL